METLIIAEYFNCPPVQHPTLFLPPPPSPPPLPLILPHDIIRTIFDFTNQYHCC